MKNLFPILFAVVVLSSGCDPDGYSCNSLGCYEDNDAQYLTLDDCLSVCDDNDETIVTSQGNYLFTLYGPPPIFSVTGQTGKNVLVEDFTAHQCGNCPQAAIIAEELVENGGGKVFAVAIHAGFLAYTNDEYPTDWTCVDGDFLWNQLDFQANPFGRINRTGGPGNFFSTSQWEEIVETEMQLETPVEIQVETSWHSNAGHLNIHAHGHYFENTTGDHRLSILITESNLIGHQLDYSSYPEHITYYEFNHLLRGSVTGAEGLVAISDAQEGDHFQSDFTFIWNEEWVYENSHLLAIVSDEDGYILNCLGIHLTN